MKPFLFVLFALVALSSCGGESAASYGKRFCDCIEQHQGQHKECADIMSEALREFPSNKGKEAFMQIAKPCLNK
jgi:hypothetical protein